MPLDAMVLTALRRELENTVLNAKVDRISMPERDLLILSLHTREGNRKLLISLRPGSARIHLTGQSFENPPQPPMFCMLLRKYLSGARITALEQPMGERMLLLRMDSVDELNIHTPKTLAVELMGKGLNLVLVGEDGRILDCLRRVDYESGARRTLLPGLFYTLPPEQDKPSFFRLGEEELTACLQKAGKEGEPEKWLQNSFGGLSPLICRELSLDGWDGLEATLLALRRRLEREDYAPVLLSERGEPKDFSFMPIRQYGTAREMSLCTDFCTMLDGFYACRDRSESLRRRGAELSRTVRTARDRLLRKTAARESELRATENREEYRRRGDLITANIYRLQRGMRSFEAQDYYAEDCPTVTIPLDERKSPQQNAAQNYKLYTKAKTANRMLTELIATAREETAYLETVLDELARAEGDRDLADIRRELIRAGYIKEKAGGKRQKLPAPRKPLRFLADDGSEILVGRGNEQNDELTFRIARKGDLWFHVKNIPGSHVILSQAGGAADAGTIRQAATLAVTFSQAAGGGKTAVDCTEVRYVKKPSGAKPGRVIYTNETTLIVQADPALAERLRRES